MTKLDCPSSPQNEAHNKRFAKKQGQLHAGKVFCFGASFSFMEFIDYHILAIMEWVWRTCTRNEFDRTPPN